MIKFLLFFLTENLTRFGNATQSSTEANGHAQNAIKPPISNAWSFDKCTHTIIGNNPAWWMFTFSFESVYITDIIIYYREGCKYTPEKYIHVTACYYVCTTVLYTSFWYVSDRNVTCM